MKPVLASVVMLVSIIATVQGDVSYSTDFSTDPGWQTNYPSLYYWDQGSESYFFNYNNMAPGSYPNAPFQYYGHSISGLDGSFDLNWDVKINSVGYSACINFGLLPSDPTGLAGEYVFVDFCRVDGGLVNAVYINGSEGPGSVAIYNRDSVNKWSEGVWYTVHVGYDASTDLIDYQLRNKDTLDLLWARSLAVPGGFSPDSLQFLGGNWYSYNYDAWNRTCNGFIDNVSLTSTVPAPGALLLAGMGMSLVGWLRKRQTL